MRKVLAFPVAVLAGHAAFNRRPWHPGAPRRTIEDHLIALVRKWRNAGAPRP